MRSKEPILDPFRPWFCHKLSARVHTAHCAQSLFALKTLNVMGSQNKLFIVCALPSWCPVYPTIYHPGFVFPVTDTDRLQSMLKNASKWSRTGNQALLISRLEMTLQSFYNLLQLCYLTIFCHRIGTYALQKYVYKPTMLNNFYKISSWRTAASLNKQMS